MAGVVQLYKQCWVEAIGPSSFNTQLEACSIWEKLKSWSRVKGSVLPRAISFSMKSSASCVS